MESRSSLRERKKRQTHDELVRAAVELFEAQGFEATTVDEVAERANYSRATFFRYFPSKEDVVFLDLGERLVLFRERLRQPLPGERPWETAENALAEHIMRTFVLDDAAESDDAFDLQRACVQLWLAEPSLGRRYAEIVAEWETELTAYFLEELGESAHLEARVMAMMVISVGRAVTEAHLTTDEDFATLLRRGYAAADGAYFKVTGVSQAKSALTEPTSKRVPTSRPARRKTAGTR